MEDKSKDDKDNNCCTPATKNNSPDHCAPPYYQNAILEFHSTCALLLKAASQISERELFATFLFLLIFYFLLIKVEVIPMLLTFYLVGECIKEYGRRKFFIILFGWVGIGCAVWKSVDKIYIFEECCSNVRHPPFLFEMTTSRNAKIQGVPFYSTTEDLFLSQQPELNFALLESNIVEKYLNLLWKLQLMCYYNSISSFVLEFLPLKFRSYFMNLLLLLTKIILIPLSYKLSKKKYSILVSSAIAVCTAILLVAMNSKEEYWSAEHRPPFVVEMRVQTDSRIKGLPYFVTEKYNHMHRDAILQQEVETSVVNYYEGNIRSCLRSVNSIETCLDKVIAEIQRNDIVNLRLSLESALYFNLYEENIRSCLKNMNSIEMCIHQIIVEIQRDIDDYKKAVVDLYDGDMHSCLRRTMNNKDFCIQNITSEVQRNTIEYSRPSLKTLNTKLYASAIPIALYEYEVRTKMSMLRHYHKRDGTSSS